MVPLFAWGDAPSWLAVVFAGVAAVYAAGAFRLERLRDDRSEQLRLREQASLVAAWDDLVPLQDHDPATGNSVLGAERFVIVVRNASELPITDLEYALIRRSDGNVLVEGIIGHIRPGDTLTIPVDENLMPEIADIRLQFTDAQALVWQRYRGRLEAAEALPSSSMLQPAVAAVAGVARFLRRPFIPHRSRSNRDPDSSS